MRIRKDRRGRRRSRNEKNRAMAIRKKREIKQT
jgi:hypothetical protein